MSTYFGMGHSCGQPKFPVYLRAMRIHYLAAVTVFPYKKADPPKMLFSAKQVKGDNLILRRGSCKRGHLISHGYLRRKVGGNSSMCSALETTYDLSLTIMKSKLRSVIFGFTICCILYPGV